MTQGNQVATSQPKTQLGMIKNYINSNVVQKLFTDRLGKQSADFTNSLIELVTGNTNLQGCAPQEIIQCAMKAASLHLALNPQLGRAYVLPFKNKGKLTPTFVIGYKGLVQMAKNSGQYRTLNSGVVFEGQISKRDYISGEIVIDKEPVSNKVEGFFAYMEELTGFKKMLFMSVNEMAHYAKIYSPSLKFSEKVTEEVIKKKFQLHAEHGPEPGVGWLADSLTMAKKVVLKQLLDKWGSLSIEMQKAISEDDTQESNQDFSRGEEITEANGEFTMAEEVEEVAAGEPASSEKPAEENNETPFPDDL